MTILEADIKLLASERMSDASDGGGRRTAIAIPDGVAGNVFPKISRVDSVYGRVNLRKVYGHVATPNLDVYAGAHFIITDAPNNDRIHVTAFSTASDFDTRVGARDRIESYVIAGPISRLTLYGRQLLGSQAVLAYQRPTEPLPEIGDVYALSNEAGVTTINQQFVRISDVSAEVRTFTDEGGEFQTMVVTIKISAPLRYEFYGPATPVRISGSSSSTGRIRSTTVADAARYFGIMPLAAAAPSGALDFAVTSVYAPLVPSTQRETPLSLVSVAGAQMLRDCAVAPLLDVAAAGPHSVGSPYNPETKTYTVRGLRAIKKGSLRLRFRFAGYVFSGSGFLSDWFYEDGSGQLVSGSTAQITVVSGTVDYESGSMTSVIDTLHVSGDLQIEMEYIPAVGVSQPAHTKAIPITLATRGTVYAIPLLPIPAPGTLLLDYRALGKWYRLRDDGNGELVGGDAQYGTGTIDYANGAATVTLGALPDVGSSIILSWGSPVHYEIRTADTGAGPFQEFTLTNLPIKAGTFTCAFLANGVTYNITSDEAGVLSGGGATGTVDQLTGAVRINYATRLPDFDSTLNIGYTSFVINPVQPAGTVPPTPGGVTPGGPTTATVSVSDALVLSLGTSVAAGTWEAAAVHCEPMPGGSSLMVRLTTTADGKVLVRGGTMFMLLGGAEGEIVVADSAKIVGTIDNATGAVTLTGSVTVMPGIEWNHQVGGWARPPNVVVPLRFITGRGVTIGYTPATVTVDAPGGGTTTVPTATLATIDTPRTASLDVATTARVYLDLTATSTSAIVPGSVMFDAAGETFIDRNGTLYTDLQANGSGTPAGSIDYATGRATLGLWTRGAAVALAVRSCLVKFGEWTATSVFFRTAGSPLRPASLYVQATAADGALLSGTADQNGNITGPDMVGKIEQTMGVAAVSFGRMVTAAGNEAEPWYDAANVVAGMIFKPREVMPSTLRYSAVVLSNLPLNADILGLDPTRLPSDGRAPIYRPADVAVIHHTAAVGAGTPSGGTIIDVGRTDLSALWIEDANRKKLDPALYTANLATGIATMAAPLSLAGYTPPLSVRHRIEEMLLLSDVQINGQISTTAPLLRTYPAGSYLSSALLFGDLQARVTNVFEQATWLGVWQDTLGGTAPPAQFDDVNYPLEVINNGAITERWRVQFTSGSAFQLIGQNLGVIATGSTAADLQPVNSLTGLPYFTLRKNGWGLGWAVGNQLRFDTIGAAPPIWLARTVLPGATLAGDSFDAQLRGDVD